MKNHQDNFCFPKSIKKDLSRNEFETLNENKLIELRFLFIFFFVLIKFYLVIFLS